MDSNIYLRFLCLCLGLLSLHSITAEATNSTAPPEDKPFFQSDAFIGLAIGVGAVGGTLILCCVLWKCFCSDVDK